MAYADDPENHIKEAGATHPQLIAWFSTNDAVYVDLNQRF